MQAAIGLISPWVNSMIFYAAAMDNLIAFMRLTGVWGERPPLGAASDDELSHPDRPRRRNRAAEETRRLSLSRDFIQQPL